MQFLSSRGFFTGCLAALQLLVSIVTVAPQSAWAQSSDTEPPSINIQPVAEGIRGDSQVFTATVVDNISVASVILHFRLDGESLYETHLMQALGNTDIYTATIETNDVVEAVRSIQYYIEASDAVGNRTLEGFAFDPIERKLVDQQLVVQKSGQATSTEPRATPNAGMSTGRKVLYGLLGVIVVGALASSSSGGGAGAESGVDVTVTVDSLQ